MAEAYILDLELLTIMSRMSMEECCVIALPEFGINWLDVSRAVSNARVPMTAGSVARVLCRRAAKSMPVLKLEEIVARIRLKLAASQNHSWHVIELSEKRTGDLRIMLLHTMERRVSQALRDRRRDMRPEVQSVLFGDLMYFSIQLIPGTKSVLFAATRPGQPVALVSSLQASSLINGLVEGLGYKKYKNANLYGQDIRSLLRIHQRGRNKNP